MKNIGIKVSALFLLLALIFNILSCDISGETDGQGQQNTDFYIEGDNALTIKVGESITLNIVNNSDTSGNIEWTSSSECTSVEGGRVTGLSEGIAVIKATLGKLVDRVTVTVVKGDEDTSFGSEYPCITIAEAREIALGYYDYASSESYYIVATVSEISNAKNGEMTIFDDTGSIYVYKSTYQDGSKINTGELSAGDVILIYGTLRNYKGKLEIERGVVIDYYSQSGDKTPSDGTDTDEDTSDIDPGDPYTGINNEEFYSNYTPATSYQDAIYRTRHNLMSGSIAEQDQAPTIAEHQPKSNGKYIRNNVYLFSDDKNTYYVVDSYGEIVLEIYRGGAYVVLEEVAAYVFAFGEPPANHFYSKNTSPLSSEWGEYLRVNNTKFSGNTNSYPYEPALPRISGCGGDLTYYEMDIGTTGTDCDPSFPCEIYNDGYNITRGAARIVYSCYDSNGNKIIDLDERYVFYTYNHYNDFQEYLNYYGGWGEIFGNITGGGTISSKYDYKPTPYVEVELGDISEGAPVTIIYYYIPSKEYTF